MSGSAIDPRDLRVSDDERTHVLHLLERATGRGLIDIAEYAERSAAVIAARTRRDLNALLLDLPGLQIGGRQLDEAQYATRAVERPTPGYAGVIPGAQPAGPAAVLELTGWGSRTFKGYWTVPPVIIVGGAGASTRLDFVAAQLMSRTITVQFRSNFGGSADLVVPRGAQVRTDDLVVRGGRLDNRVAPRPGVSGSADGMILVLTGVKKAGSVTIRHPRQGLLSHLF